jgi:predicted DNA-binding transcriptional regulator AlpA
MAHATPIVIDEAQAAQMLGVSVRTLQRWRIEGAEASLPYCRLGERRIGYMVADIEAWVRARRITSTSAIEELSTLPRLSKRLAGAADTLQVQVDTGAVRLSLDDLAGLAHTLRGWSGEAKELERRPAGITMTTIDLDDNGARN